MTHSGPALSIGSIGDISDSTVTIQNVVNQARSAGVTDPVCAFCPASLRNVAVSRCATATCTNILCVQHLRQAQLNKKGHGVCPDCELWETACLRYPILVYHDQTYRDLGCYNDQDYLSNHYCCFLCLFMPLGLCCFTLLCGATCAHAWHIPRYAKEVREILRNRLREIQPHLTLNSIDIYLAIAENSFEKFEPQQPKCSCCSCCFSECFRWPSASLERKTPGEKTHLLR